ncbi:glutathione S-transferase [Thiomicrorhabdus sp. Milos-T2]|uniref:glutathione S-transferase n=1 Tax=Thiomicrorhabdus sp. Milos-T2 TaxID=90814 RepID=UPI0021013438|nr:glutathione S-transferase [Thiomicrorhabdus sp. Milos-T2]
MVFWEKPEQMLLVSPKGTVPVLILPGGKVIDESRDIMLWALKQNKQANQAWLFDDNAEKQAELNAWIDACDNKFKTHLDHYKYADRFPEFSQDEYREQGCEFLNTIEQQLKVNQELVSENSGFALINNKLSMADIALFPFVRQFANVDKAWFTQSEFIFVRRWLEQNLALSYFQAIMKNRPVWNAKHQPLLVDEPEILFKNQFVAKAEQS